MRLVDEVSDEVLVGLLNVFQGRGIFHPFTCGVCGPPGRDCFPLVARLGDDGPVLVCVLCGFVQRVLRDSQCEAACQMALLPRQVWEKE